MRTAAIRDAGDRRTNDRRAAPAAPPPQVLAKKQDRYLYFALGSLVAAIVISLTIAFASFPEFRSAVGLAHVMSAAPATTVSETQPTMPTTTVTTTAVTTATVSPTSTMDSAPARVIKAIDDKDPRQAFSRSVSRLSDALSAASPRSPESVLRDLSEKKTGCAFEFKNGQPALLLGAGKTIASSLDTCSDAVEKTRIAKK